MDQARRTFDHFTNNLTSGPNVVNKAYSLSSEQSHRFDISSCIAIRGQTGEA
jgi:hypothetical protein